MNEWIVFLIWMVGVAIAITVIVYVGYRLVEASERLDTDLRDEPWNDGRYDHLPMSARQHLVNRGSQDSGEVR